MCPCKQNEVSTGSDSDRVIILAISILAINDNPVAIAPGTDCITASQIGHYPWTGFSLRFFFGGFGGIFAPLHEILLAKSTKIGRFHRECDGKLSLMLCIITLIWC